MINSTITTAATESARRGMQIGRGMHAGYFHPILMLLAFMFFVLFIILIVKMVVFARSRYGLHYEMEHHFHQMNGCDHEKMGHCHMHEKSDEALEILRKRFASGEINKEEFEEKEKILKG
jgi:uncharacterized membrane protein